ncbi:hypothetical protein ANO11243_084500 [Dothideomycetidae sp. 11243]|nr:hypothetical protein ANO11243_084500 [fungal sp. No.11243]
MHGLAYLNTFLASVAVAFVTLTRVSGYETGDALVRVGATSGSFLLGLAGSTMIWRIFFNPLNKLPGPWGARLGSLYWSTKLTKSDAYLKLQALHEKYGRVVRIGSSDLSIVDPSIMDAAYGKHAIASKGSWYDGDSPLTSMHTTRDKTLHEKRRKIWVPAFSEKAIRDYESRISELVDLLIRKVEQTRAAPLDVTTLFNLFTFDVMALLAFGKDYGMLESGKKHYALKLLGDGMQPLALWFPTWLFRVLIAIPGASAGYQKFVNFCKDELNGRIANQVEANEKGKNDIMSWILRAYKNIDNPGQDTMLQADVRLLIVAGSDTTAACLTYMFYYLAEDPAQVEKLRKELQPMVERGLRDQDISQSQHLNACIWEALRLNPPVPSGVQRLTPPEGMMADGKHIPGNTTFWMPQYVMGRDEECYENANAFIPERWTTKPEMVKSKEAWAPFSMGPMGCIGKSLAMMELRTVTARLVTRFNVSLAPGEDGHQLFQKTKDHFTLELGDLELVFKEI